MISNKRIMGLDVGDARIGVALSDPLGIAAHPHCTIERNSAPQCLEQISQLIVHENVGSVVVGVPYELSGKKGEQANKVQAFVDKLTAYLRKSPGSKDIPIAYWDERFTTAAAEYAVVGSKLKNKERRAALDRISAALILESYMACNNVSS